MPKFHLYLDESGNFNAEDEYDDYSQSQLAGVLVFASNQNSDIYDLNKLAQEILDKSYQESYNKPPLKTYHGNKLTTDENYDLFIQNLLVNIAQDSIAKKNWQAVRLVNQEKIDYGHPQDNYLYMVAELVFRIARQKFQEGIEDIKFNIYPASRDSEKKDYESTINKILKVLEVRKELSSIQVANELKFDFSIDRIIPIKANDNYLLQVSDLLSNASFNNYYKVDKKTTRLNLEKAFTQYNYTLVIPLFSQRTEALIKEGSLGLALRFVLLNLDDLSYKKEAKLFLEKIIKKLVDISSSERNAHLSYLISWLQQEINQKRNLEQGAKLADRFNKYIYQKLVVELEENYAHQHIKNTIDSLTWFKYALHYWALTAYNHSGRLASARRQVEELDLLKSKLYQQIEHLGLLMDGLVTQAVHYTDCFEFNKAIEQTQFVIDFYDYFFAQEMVDFFTQESIDNSDDNISNLTIKSDAKAKALSTCLQAQIFQFLQTQDAQLLEKARKNSDRCIEEFISIEDKRRQYQYRCHLETLTCNFQSARQYLADSLGLPRQKSSYLDIINHLQTIEIENRGFPLLHLFRLGHICYLNNEEEEWNKFQQALRDSNILSNNIWCRGDKIDYPIHGILRRIVSFALIMGNKTRAVEALNSLNNLKPIEKSPVFGLIQIATYAEYIALVWQGEVNSEFKKRVGIKPQKNKITLNNLLDKMKDKYSSFDSITDLTVELKDKIDSITENKIFDVKQELLIFAQKIGY